MMALPVALVLTARVLPTDPRLDEIAMVITVVMFCENHERAVLTSTAAETAATHHRP